MTTEQVQVYCDTLDEPDSGFLFHLGAYGWTKVAILGYGLSLEDALELCFEWCDDNAPGILSTIGLAEYGDSARELGYPWQDGASNVDNVTGEDMARIVEHAETDMTMCSHTTLKNGNCIPSWEWSARELSRSEVEAYAAQVETGE